MNRGIPLRRTCALSVTVGVALFFVVSSQSECAERRKEQQTPQSQQQTSEPQQQASQPQKTPETPAQPQAASGSKPKKVWSNDDVVSLRTPADVYLVEKEAQEAADAKEAVKKADLARQMKEAGLTIKLPSTSEETQRLIEDKEAQIRDWQAWLDRLNHDLPDAPEQQKEAIQKQRDALTSDLQKDQLELKVLRDHLHDLPTTTTAGPPSAPDAPSSPQNPL